MASSRRALDGLMSRGDRGDGGPEIHFAVGAVSVGAGASPAGGAEVWLARYDPRVVEVAVRRGENAGRTLPHRDVVHEMILLGHWRGLAETFPLPGGGEAALADAVIVQAADAGPVLAAAKAR